MKKLIIFLFIINFLSGNAFSLPACPKDINATWSNCYGIIDFGGIRYVGDFLNNKRHGQGSVTEYGVKYIGDWKNGLRHGEGVQTFSGNAKIKTPFSLKNSKSKRYSINQIYKGSWINGEKNGYGSFKYSKKSNYMGFWSNDLMNGLGSLLLEDGSRMSGEWRNGELKKNIKYCEENLIHNCFMHMSFKNGTYFGYFQKGEFDGKGIFKYSDGSIYQGTYKEGKENGYGSLTNSDGTKYDGIWINGRIVKEIGTSDRKFLKESLKKLYYYNSDTEDTEFNSFETIDFYSALTLFLYDEGECNLAKAIENKTSKLENTIIKENDKSCLNIFFSSFRLRNYNMKNKSIYQLLVLFIFNDKFYSLLKNSISRTQ